MNEWQLLLEDTIEFQGVPFLVQVEERDMFIHSRSGEVRGINMHGAPTGMKRGGRKWVVCRSRVGKIRPDYPHEAQGWTEHVQTHHKHYEPLEVPSRGIIFYGTEDREPQRDAQELAEDAIESLKDAYEEWGGVETLK